MKNRLKKMMTTALTVSMMFSMFTLSSHAADNVGTSEKATEMYKNTYSNLTERITSRGYAPTSLTGAYEGMFIRDSSIQIMAQNAYGDYQKSREVLKYLLSYQQGLGASYAQHIVPNFDDLEFNNTYLSQKESKPIQSYYSSQTFCDHALFGMKSPDNGGGVSFQADSDKLESISIFTNTTGNDVLKGSLRTKIDDASTEIASKDLTITQTGWQTFTFDNPISVNKGQTYYFFVQANNSVAMFGKADGKPADNAIMGYNYDIPVLHGFAQSAYPAFKINAKAEENVDNSFMSNTDHSIGLFLINATTNNSAFAFIPNTNSIRSFKVYLTGNAPVTFKLTTEPGNESKTIKTVSQNVSNNGWQTVDFKENIPVKPGEKYYVHIATTSNQVVAYGSTMFEGAIASMNWENNVWTHTGYVIAAEVFSEVNVGQNAYAQKMSINGDAIQAVSFQATAKVAGGSLTGELRESLDGKAVASGKVDIKEAGTQNYYIDFGKEISVDSSQSYYFVLSVKDNNDVQWNYNPAIKGNAYGFNQDHWDSYTYDFELNIYPLYSGEYRMPLISIGEDSIGVQEIPSLNEYVTAVDVLIGRNNSEKGNAIATLYKGYGKNAIEIDSKTIDISKLSQKGQMVHLEFGLSLEQIDKKQSYYLEIKAPNNSDKTITWYGTKTIDKYETLQNNSSIEGEAGFVAYKSNLRTLSNHVQIDGNYMLIHAWAQFVDGCKDSKENKEFIEQSYPIIKKFADYYIDQGYISDTYQLMRNDSLEHSREGRYWKSYDLITNVFASQALHELSLLAKKFEDKTSSEKWENISKTLTKGIQQYLITEVDNVKIYGELYDIDNNMKFIKGMSWVNWAPMAAQWYAMDKTIMQNTYDIYAKYDSQDYDGYMMLDAAYDFETQQGGNHVIGKGLAWEIMFNRYKNDNDKLNYLSQFILDHSTEGGIYPETYQPNGHFSDVGNQEHASWQHYAMSYAYPELTKTYSFKKLDEIIKEVEKIDSKLYTLDSYKALKQVIEQAKLIYTSEDATKEQCDKLYDEILNKKEKLVYLDADYSLVEKAIEKANKIDRVQYTKDTLAKLDETIQAVEKGLNITKQKEVNAMAQAIEAAIESLKYKDADYSQVDAAIKIAEKLNKNEYKDFSQVDEAIKAVIRDKNITEQKQVDIMAENIMNAIAALEKIEIVVTPDDSNGNKPDVKPDKPNTTPDVSQTTQTADTSAIVLYGSLISLSLCIFVVTKKRRIKKS